MGRWLRKQSKPDVPRLVSRQGAAEILGVSSPHMDRIAHRLPDAVPVQGSSWKAYPLDDIKALATELKRERRERQEEM